MDKNFLSAQIGQRLRFYRQQRNLSLDEVAELTGVSKPMLGQIERGTSNPTVAVLWKIAAGLQVPIASFLMQNPSIKYLPLEDQPFIKEDDNLFETYNTFASPGIPIENYRIRILPGCTHQSEAKGIGVIKIVTVYTGALLIKIGDEEYNLKKGDSISFSSDIHQVYQNLMDEPCEFNLIIQYSNPQFV